MFPSLTGLLPILKILAGLIFFSANLYGVYLKRLFLMISAS